MEIIGQTLSKRKGTHQFEYNTLVKKILNDADVSAFIKDTELTQSEINRSISKFNQYISERNRFLSGDEDYAARGYKPVLVKNEGYADISYEETPELIERERKALIKERLHLINLPTSLKEACLADIKLDDASRVQTFEFLTNFLVNFPETGKAIYLYGDFGIGKSYMMAALAHDLSERKSVSTTLLHYPSFVIDVKNAINSGSVKDKIDSVKTTQVLILDDIGAEQASSWIRDEILQVILQHRMQEKLPTFFTSNLSLAELERHFSGNRLEDESWQARRVLERIRFLANEIRLEGENRR